MVHHKIRSRKFSVVIHDVKPESKSILEKEINYLSPDWYLIAEEPYNHQIGFHIHLFIKYNQPRSKFRVLKFIQDLNLGGRVQVDIGRGDFNECKKYITDPEKIKKLDKDIVENVVRISNVERYPDQTQICSFCGQKYWDPPDPCFKFVSNYCGRISCRYKLENKNFKIPQAETIS